jgi:hypothetical protein
MTGRAYTSATIAYLKELAAPRSQRQPRGVRVRQWNRAPVTKPSRRPRTAEEITNHTSETDEEPTTQLTLTWPVLAITSAMRHTSKATVGEE